MDSRRVENQPVLLRVENLLDLQHLHDTHWLIDLLTSDVPNQVLADPAEPNIRLDRFGPNRTFFTAFALYIYSL